MRVLLIEDDRQMADYLRKALSEVGAVADHAADGREGLLQAASGDYDALIVDRMLPGLDGLAIIRTLRASGNQTPVLILSALGEVDDRVEGLRAGGDDYLVKPFAFSELHARLEALLRRGASEAPRPGCGSPTWRWTCSSARSPAPDARSSSSPGSSGCWST
jgi:two-component system, OmpR family, response regulator